jgi:UDP-N-acetyl-D-mannosaminuronic acid transferase (WecB/TagA/CpsF family)
VRELVGGTAQSLLASGQLTPEALFAASQKHPWALGNLGGKAGAATQVAKRWRDKLILI